MGTGPDKIYFNITINHNENKLISTERKTSIAHTEINLLDPLITNTNQYDMCISKFRLDTFTIPLIIPELKQPQKIIDSKIELDYWIKLVKFNEPDDYSTSFPTSSEKTYLSIIPKNMNPDSILVLDELYNTLDCYTFQKPFVRKNSDNLGFLNNLDPFCYIYEPQEFLDSINRALAEVCSEFFTEDNNEEIYTQAFFTLEGGKLKFYQRARKIPYFIIFSPNLYKYFGFGFNTRRMPSQEGWFIANDVDSRNFINDSSFSFSTNLIANPDILEKRNLINEITEENADYNIAVNHFAITQTWNACKTILICSNTLPVGGEYIPISENDGLLIHENTQIGRQNYHEFHDGQKDGTSLGEVSVKTPSVKVLESYYPISSEGGDMRTQIIFSNDTIDTSTKLSLQGEHASLRKFDICIKWVDIFNNMHDLELMPGNSCDIRIAFVKKSVKQDLVVAGMKEISQAIKGEDKYAPPKKRGPFTDSKQLKNGGFNFNLDNYF